MKLLVLLCALLALSPGCHSTSDATGPGDDTDSSNEAPEAQDDSAVTFTDLRTQLNLTANDYNPNGSNAALEIIGVLPPQHGSVEIEDSQHVSYQSEAEFTGVDPFSYTVSDGELTDQAEVIVTVMAPPTLEITAPLEDETVAGTSTEVSLTVEGCTLTESSSPEGCHLHRYLDGHRWPDGHDYNYYSTASFPLGPLTVGIHEFQLVLIKNDGTDDSFTPGISASVTFWAVDPEP